MYSYWQENIQAPFEEDEDKGVALLQVCWPAIGRFPAGPCAGESLSPHASLLLCPRRRWCFSRCYCAAQS